MKKVEKKSGKQRLKNAELGTENRKTHDVEPKTLNAEHKTLVSGGSISSMWFRVSSPEFWNFTSDRTSFCGPLNLRFRRS